jgi:hypothetical protein
VNILMASDTCGATLEEALALPQPNGVVGEAARASVRPISRVRVYFLTVLEDWKKRIVVIVARFEIVANHIAKRVALSADHGIAPRIQARL